ncbi:DoxX family protein [Bizionia paragorgiae]|jgi:putative oxidoreductase|uniref:Putative oxidoreductase n=1 Tax=Bizionia paragorgiae TaxID=283786 RepID=A0A1H3ZDX6_BIZPA|nr:DoxX family protein [Bizionia paragorgiae]MDX1271329.1 DoxX family protein [Bizionia paragorgiae]SEA21969.1 putative oxidoreductase [Bizionia paragorgiae]
MMNTPFKTNNLSIALLILRVGAGGLMLIHGIPKLQMLFSGEIQFPGVMGLSPTISLILAVFSEVLCSVLILIGLKTRLATIPLILTMLIAVFMIHASDPFAKQELGLLYLFLYIPLFLLGSGKFSVDALMQKK